MAQWIEFHSLRQKEPPQLDRLLEIKEKAENGERSEKGGLLSNSKEFEDSSSGVDLPQRADLLLQQNSQSASGTGGGIGALSIPRN